MQECTNLGGVVGGHKGAVISCFFTEAPNRESERFRCRTKQRCNSAACVCCSGTCSCHLYVPEKSQILY